MSCFVVAVMNVVVMKLSTTSAAVSWDKLTVHESSVYSLHGYLIYYNKTEPPSEEQSKTLPITKDRWVIKDLEDDVDYQFFVAVIVELYGALDTRVLTLATELPRTSK